MYCVGLRYRIPYLLTNINEYSSSVWSNQSNNSPRFILLYDSTGGAFSNIMNSHFVCSIFARVSDCYILWVYCVYVCVSMINDMNLKFFTLFRLWGFLVSSSDQSKWPPPHSPCFLKGMINRSQFWWDEILRHLFLSQLEYHFLCWPCKELLNRNSSWIECIWHDETV